LRFHGTLAGLAEPAAFAAWQQAPYRQDWVVYAKESVGGLEQVLKYLARYTPRVALSNRRLVGFDGEQVQFTAKDDVAGGRPRVVRLPAEEFLRRWAQHVLPYGFGKIRHYGLLANRGRVERLGWCRALLARQAVVGRVVGLLSAADEAEQQTRRCPACGAGPWSRSCRERPAGPAPVGGRGSGRRTRRRVSG
jgi:hypothetical protein